MKRRSFLKSGLAILGSATFLSFAYPLLRFLSPLKGRVNAEKLVIRKSEVVSGSARNIVLNNKPVMVIHRPGKGFIALSRVCTHLGCLVSYHRAEQKIICPCHAAAFSLEGKVLSGPAPKPLERIPLKVEAERIVIG